jgi:hypothetical protein
MQNTSFACRHTNNSNLEAVSLQVVISSCHGTDCYFTLARRYVTEKEYSLVQQQVSQKVQRNSALGSTEIHSNGRIYGVEVYIIIC